jgi:hypothetical protein
MIQTHSDDPDVGHAAAEAAVIVNQVLASLPEASRFDYGGHILSLGEYGVCIRCTKPIAEAQQASRALFEKADSLEDGTVVEHLLLAAELLKLEAHAAEIRAEFHNGQGSETILNNLLGHIHDRQILDSYDHSHHGGQQ